MLRNRARVSHLENNYYLSYFSLKKSSEFKKFSQSQNPPEYLQSSKNSSCSSIGIFISFNIISALVKSRALHPIVSNNSSNLVKNFSKSLLFILYSLLEFIILFFIRSLNPLLFVSVLAVS